MQFNKLNTATPIESKCSEIDASIATINHNLSSVIDLSMGNLPTQINTYKDFLRPSQGENHSTTDRFIVTFLFALTSDIFKLLWGKTPWGKVPACISLRRTHILYRRSPEPEIRKINLVIDELNHCTKSRL